jgi:hypothetical protein
MVYFQKNNCFFPKNNGLFSKNNGLLWQIRGELSAYGCVVRLVNTIVLGDYCFSGIVDKGMGKPGLSSPKG